MSDTRQRIIGATLELMAERGLSGITMSAVADSAGVARQTLYNHFPSVEDIVTAALDAHRVDIGDDLSTMLATFDDPAEQLAHLVRHVAASAAHHPPLPLSRHGLSAQVQATLAAHERGLRSLIVDLLRSGAETGGFRSDLDPDRDGHLVQAMLQRVSDIAAAEPEAIAEITASATRTMLAAVTSRD